MHGCLKLLLSNERLKNNFPPKTKVTVIIFHVSIGDFFINFIKTQIVFQMERNWNCTFFDDSFTRKLKKNLIKSGQSINYQAVAPSMPSEY